MYNTLNSEQKNWVDSIFAALTLDEKIGQLVNEHGGNFLLKNAEPVEWLRKYPVGSLFCGSEVIDVAATKLNAMHSLEQVVTAAALKTPMLLSGDFENGIGGNIDGFTRMPRLMGAAATFEPDDYYRYGHIIGSEARALDIRWAFGPVSDLNLNRENPVSNIRTAGDDPDHAITVLKNVMQGMHDCGCAACPKHFPGDGTDTRNQHYVTSFNTLTKPEWDRFHGRVFRELIEAGAMSLMIGHLAFPEYEAMDPVKKRFRPATASRKIMTDLLRGELGFNGIILTDALCMNGFIAWGDYEERILDAFNGGVDVFLWPETPRFFALLKAALADGRVSEERLNESVRRILSFKALLKLNEPRPAITEDAVSELLERNAAAANTIARHSITLLQNQRQILPLQLEPGAKILVLRSPNKAAALAPLAEFSNGLSRRGFSVTNALLDEFEVVQDVIENFEAVFLLSNANPQYGEYRGFHNMLWPFMACKKIKRRIIISFGTPYMLYDVAEADTYINSYHDSVFSVRATLDAIFGDIPFQGQSPVSVPHCFALGDGIRA